ncbi:MAG: DUF362 domain-containing protein [Deltaproteobacteria bacterium]|nr:DUF362 domain-containing protein [Deltaproteobacteria bacterium]
MTRPVGPVAWARWMARGTAVRLRAPPTPVALAACPAYDASVLDAVRDLWQAADMPDVRGRRVLVKPNLVDVVEGRPTCTAPEVVAAVLDVLAERGVGEVVVGEGPAFRRDTRPLLTESGLAAVLARRNVRFVDLNYDDPRPVPLREPWFREVSSLWLPRHVVEADLVVSVPKMKCHHWAGVTLALKNLIGVVPGVRYGWPKNFIHCNGIAPSILGIHQALPAVVAIVDGIVGMEGDGPVFGNPVRHGVLAASADALAVDVVCAGLMGFDPDEVSYLAAGRWAGVGRAARIEFRGAEPERLERRYERPPCA